MSEKSIYAPKDNGDLKFIADAETDEGSDFLIDTLLDQNPRLSDRTFAVIDLDAGTVEVVTVESDEPVRPRRNIVVQGGGGGNSSGNNEGVVEERPQTQRRKPGPKPGSKRAKPGPKPKASAGKAKPKPRAGKAKAGRSKPKGGAFGRKAEND